MRLPLLDLDHGADVNVRNGRGSTSLIEAVEGGYEAVVWLLLDRGADVNARSDRRSTSGRAASSRSREPKPESIADGLAEAGVHGQSDYESGDSGCDSDDRK